VGVDVHPFVARVAEAKLSWTSDPDALVARGKEVLAAAQNVAVDLCSASPLTRKCFPDDALTHLLALREAVEATRDGSPADGLSWLALGAIRSQC
jgi:hypothetical protein